jgi:hypothetical protein
MRTHTSPFCCFWIVVGGLFPLQMRFRLIAADCVCHIRVSLSVILPSFGGKAFFWLLEPLRQHLAADGGYS